MKNLNYIQGAFILTLTNLITGILAFIYRIFLTRTIGSEGIGIYQLVLPLYSLFITLVSGGIITAVSKLTSEQYARRNTKNMYKIIRICCFVIGIWSMLISVAVALNAELLSKYILKDLRTTYSIIVFTPAIFFIAVSAVFKGYFYGMQDVKAPAYIDIVEKFIRLFVLGAITYFMLPFGIGYVCAGAMAAMTSGELVSLLLLYLVYKRSRLSKAMLAKAKRSSAYLKTDRSIVIIKNIFKIALPLSVSSAFNTIMDMVNAIIIPAMLLKAGLDKKTALSTYGELTGMVFPLFFFPFIIAISLSITLVPAITTSFTSQNWLALNKKCNDSLKIASVVALAATALFIIFPNEMCRIFFNCPDAGNLLFAVSIFCIFEYWQITLFAILNGIGRQNTVLVNSILGIIITVICAYYFIPIPKIGIMGYVIGFGASAVIVTFTTLNSLRKVPQIHLNYVQILIKPMLCFAISFFIMLFINKFLIVSAITKYNMIAASILGLILYMLLLVLSGTFTVKQLKNTMSSR